MLLVVLVLGLDSLLCFEDEDENDDEDEDEDEVETNAQ